MALRFVMSFSAQTIDQEKFLTQLQRDLRRLMREAAAIYYTNLMFALPVDTGFLAGSFAPLKQVSNATASPRPPQAQRAPSYYTHHGDRRTLKAPLNGLEYVSQPEEILTERTDGKDRLQVVFFFHNAIRYYPINDVHGSRNRPPWRITQRALKIAVAFIEANLPKVLPAAISASVRKQVISYIPGSTPQRIRIR